MSDLFDCAHRINPAKTFVMYRSANLRVFYILMGRCWLQLNNSPILWTVQIILLNYFDEEFGLRKIRDRRHRRSQALRAICCLVRKFESTSSLLLRYTQGLLALLLIAQIALPLTLHSFAFSTVINFLIMFMVAKTWLST